MPVYVPIVNYIAYGRISQFLACNDAANNALYKGGSLTPQLGSLIRIVRTSVEWQYAFNNTDESLNFTGAYLYALCGKYVSQAQEIAGSGGGVVIVPGGGTLLNLAALDVEFIVGDPGALMNNGETVLILNYSSVIRGTVVVYLDGTKLYNGVSSEQMAYTIVYNTNDVTITFNQQVNDTNRISITGLRNILA